MTALLEVRDLHVEFSRRGRVNHALRGVDYQVAPGEVLALVGESGSGKTVSATAALGLLPRSGARISSGSVLLNGRELVGLPERELRPLRGRIASVVFQDALSSFNPVLTIGRQITEQLEAHGIAKGAAARERAVELLDSVHIPDPRRRVGEYPHQLSGGMRQRAMIAMALSCDPVLLIADEPTTALDVTIQAQIIELLRDIRAQRSMAVLFITHDLGLVAGFADRVAIMYAGRVVETGVTGDVLRHPRHPYTKGLLGSVPRLDPGDDRRLEWIPGSPPDLSRPVVGCSFRDRCPFAIDRCAHEDPKLSDDPLGSAACWVAIDGERGGVGR